MRSRFLITSIVLGLALLVATALGIGYTTLRSEVQTRQARTARFCSDVIGTMRFYGEALLMSGPAGDSRERLLSSERDVAKGMLGDGYRYCLLAAGAETAQADKWSLHLGLAMNSSAVETARQALDEAIARLAQHGY